MKEKTRKQIWADENQEKVRASKRKWAKENKKKKLEWIDENQDKVKEYKRQWYLRNKDRRKAKGLTEEQKEVGRERSRKWYRDNPERHKELNDKSRKGRQEEINKWSIEWRKNNPKKYKAIHEKHKRLYPEKIKARSLANNAKRRGQLKSPSKCQICDKEKKLEMHHSNYDNPLEIVWCCKKCHIGLDKLRNQIGD